MFSPHVLAVIKALVFALSTMTTAQRRELQRQLAELGICRTCMASEPRKCHCNTSR